MRQIPQFLPRTPLRGRIADRWWSVIAIIITFALLVACWELVAKMIGSSLIPGPVQVGRKIGESWHSDPLIKSASGMDFGLGFHCLKTVLRFARFMLCGFVAASAVLALAFLSNAVRGVAQEVSWLANPIPPLLLLPILYASGWKSSGLEWSAGAFYPALAAVSIGLAPEAAAYRDLATLMRQAGAGKFWIATHIHWRVLEENLLPALKSHGAYTIGITVVIEWMFAPNGLGQVMKYALVFNSGALLMATIVLIGAITILYEGAVDLLIRFRFRWKLGRTQQ